MKESLRGDRTKVSLAEVVGMLGADLDLRVCPSQPPLLVSENLGFTPLGSGLENKLFEWLRTGQFKRYAELG